MPELHIRPLKSESVGHGFQVAGISLPHSQLRTRVLKLACASESPARLVKYLVAGPSLEFPSVVGGRVQDYAFLINSPGDQEGELKESKTAPSFSFFPPRRLRGLRLSLLHDFPHDDWTRPLEHHHLPGKC